MLRAWVIAGAIGAGAFGVPADAADYFLTIGGGYAASGNQASLEKNVRFFSGVLAALRPDNPRHEVLFADGADPRPDLQFRDPEAPPSDAQRLLGELFGDEDYDLRYRDHALGLAHSAATPEALRGKLTDLAGVLREGDRLFIYATCHGGEARRRGGARNTTLYLWENRRMDVREFTGLLDRLHPRAQVTLVMVQCYAGGFGSTVFAGGDPARGLAPAARCGFFSQTHDRPAAGCTPEINEANYQEYSSYFWAALGGYTRTGQPVEGADLNADGRVTLAEAHAYAVVFSDTIDNPLRTSDLVLAEYSRVGEGPAGRLARVEGPIARLAEGGRPEDRAIVAGLMRRLGAPAEATVDDVRNLRAEQARVASAARRRVEQASFELRRQRRQLTDAIKRLWPELEHDYTPVAAELVTSRADEFVARVRAQPNYGAYAHAHAQRELARAQRAAAEKREVLYDRLLNAGRNSVLAANLPLVASEQIVTGWRAMLTLEDAALSPSSAPTR